MSAVAVAALVAIAGIVLSRHGQGLPVAPVALLCAGLPVLVLVVLRNRLARPPSGEPERASGPATDRDLAALLGALPVGIKVLKPGGNEVLFEAGSADLTVPHLPLVARLAPAEQEGEARQITFKHAGDDVRLSLFRREIRWGGEEADLLVLSDVTRISLTEAERLRAAKLSVLGDMANAVVHEMDRPLDAIRQSTESALADLSPEQATLKGKLAVILAEAERARRISERLSTLGRMNGGIGRRRFPLLAAVEAGIRLMETPLALSSAVLLRHVEAEGEMSCAGEEDAFAQALADILANSLRGFEANGVPEPERRIHLEIRERREAGKVRLLIRDNAGGLPGVRTETLFEPFGALNGGLGLSLARRVVERCGGAISVRETGSPFTGGRRGTAVEIVLPAAYLQGADLNQAVP